MTKLGLLPEESSLEVDGENDAHGDDRQQREEGDDKSLEPEVLHGVGPGYAEHGLVREEQTLPDTPHPAQEAVRGTFIGQPGQFLCGGSPLTLTLRSVGGLLSDVVRHVFPRLRIRTFRTSSLLCSSSPEENLGHFSKVPVEAEAHNTESILSDEEEDDHEAQPVDEVQ